MTEIRAYKQLLKNVADYGHGIFTLTMLQDLKERDAMKKWITSNKSLFTGFITPPREIKIHVLTKKGMKHFDGQDSLSEGSVYSTFLDTAIVNSYMIEVDEFTQYKNEPHISIQIQEKKIGLVSYSWGLSEKLADFDQLITTKFLQKYYLRQVRRNAFSFSQGEKKRAIELLKNAHIPIAFKYYRKL